MLFISRMALVLLVTTSLTSPSFSTDTPLMSSQSPGYANLVAPLLPAVVNISTTTVVRGRGETDMSPLDSPFPKGSPLEEFMKEFYDQIQPEGPRNSSAVGSGFIVDPEGYIVTNNHLVADADQVIVTLNDNTELKATVVGRDRRTDIAVLKVNTNKKLPFVQWGDSEKIRTGDQIIAIGNPFGLGGTVTSGIVSHLGRNIGGNSRYGDFINGYIQTDASINMGNSGGPMFDMSGKVVGVNTAIYSPTGASVGIGFAIPSEVAKKIVAQIRQYGRPKRGWLGVHIQPVTEDIAEGLGLKELTGALIGSVNKDGPAAKAKLQAGDIILKVGDKEVKEPRNLPMLVADISSGTTVPITIWRKGKVMSVSVQIGEQTEAEETGSIPSPKGGKNLAKGIEIHGITLQPLTEEVRQRFDITTDAEGVLIVDVSSKSSADEKGIRPGDIIMEIGQQEVKTPQQVVEQFKKSENDNNKSALLLINHNGEARYVTIKIGKEAAGQ